ncbi:hypothetical protein [Microbacterium resistens]
MNREQMIDDAATAGARAMRGVTAHVGLRDREFAAAALSVFEEAHTPSDDEREALDRLLAAHRVGDRGLVDHILAAGFRRTVQGDHYDEGTLVKVYDALQRVMPDVSEWVIRDQVNAMQNAGILFRERRTVQGEPIADWDRVHDRPADIYTPPEDLVPRPSPEPQGEPSDAQVEAALRSMGHSGSGVTKPVMRAALRAAADAEGGNR